MQLSVMVIVVENQNFGPSSNPVCDSFLANTLRKNMNLSFTLVNHLVLEKENFEFKQTLLHLNIDLVVHATWEDKGLLKTI